MVTCIKELYFYAETTRFGSITRSTRTTGAVAGRNRQFSVFIWRCEKTLSMFHVVHIVNPLA